MTTARMRTIIESTMPTYDARLAVQVIVPAGVDATFHAARNVDFLRVRSPLLTASMWIRGLPARLAHEAPPAPPRLVLAEGIGLPGWLLLGEEPNREIAFGAVGRFWQPVIEWRDVPRADFPTFAEPGWGKIAANFAVVPHGPGSSLLSYECRTATTDPDSRRRFHRYWWLIRPFVAHIMRATVDTITADAQRAPVPGAE